MPLRGATIGRGRRAARHGRATILERRRAAGHASPQSRPQLRRASGAARGRSRHSMAGCHPCLSDTPGRDAIPVGNSSEADRCGPADDRRCRVRQHSRPRPLLTAFHRRPPGPRDRHRRRGGRYLRPGTTSRVVPPCRRGLRTIRRRDGGDTASRSTSAGRTRSRDAGNRRLDRTTGRAHPIGRPLRRLPVCDRSRQPGFPAPGDLVLLPPDR